MHRHTFRHRLPLRLLFLPAFVMLYVCFLTKTNILQSNFYAFGSTDYSVNNTPRRKLLHCNHHNCDNGTQSGSIYPADVFSMEQLRTGAVILHCIGVMYMFIALALVCDEFFVPALEVITDQLELSEDVAGATFMAAGGSAPELFTSLIGTFISKNDVGIGTIVGSAVFNILFVIGMCSFYSLTVLQLTWWPLFRDVCFYSMSLVILIIFFVDSYIETWEAVILFSCYIAYVIFMKFNAPIEFHVQQCLGRFRKTDLLESHHRSSLLHTHKSHARKSIAHLLIKHSELQNLCNVDGIDLKAEEKEEEDGTTNNSNSEERSDMSPMRITADGTSGASVTITGISTTSRDVLDEVQAQSSGVDQIDGGSSMNKSTSSRGITAEDDIAIVFEEEESVPLDMSFPSDLSDRIKYILVFPILFPVWLITPDVRKDEKRKFFIITFILSIVWIGFFSFLMVWWANTIGETMGLQAEILGVTVLAAGTSVPDLITSVIVAKKGFGDMAVSSSVGSNIFDITVGLPVPWMLKAAIKQGIRHEVQSDGLFCSIVMLFMMLVAVVTSIAVSGWKMKKMLGVAMMGLYVVFITMAVLLNEQIISCPAITEALGISI